MIPLLVASLLACGCDWLKRDPEAGPPEPPPHPRHDLVITEGRGAYDGAPLGPGVALDSWKRLLGAPSRASGPTAIWDDLGLVAFLDHGLVAGAGIVTGFRVCVEPVVDDIADADPRKPFPGRIVLDGVALSAGTHVKDVNERLRSSCRPPGGGVHFGPMGLPHHHACEADAYRYSLGLHETDPALRVRCLAVEARETKAP
jgi:hypothetical protein